MAIDPQVLSLIAVGASVAANCQPCLKRTMEMAAGQGAGRAQIAEAIEVGRRVRRGAASKMDQFAAHLQEDAVGAPAAQEAGCECSGGPAMRVSERVSKRVSEVG